MAKVVTVEEMREIEAEGNERGVTYDRMMENAGRGVAREAHNAYSHKEMRVVTGLIGPGNNGGDTLIALEQLAAMGWEAHAYLLRERPSGEDLSERLLRSGGTIDRVDQDSDFSRLSGLLTESTVILDGILGTGFRLPLRDDVADILGFTNRVIKSLDPYPEVVAVDCPSGVDCDSGEAAAESLPASITVCMEAIKIGLLNMPAASLVGEIRTIDIGLTTDLESERDIRREVATSDMVRKILPRRPPSAHKGTFGTALIVAGSVNYPGAALLAGKAAYLVGAGLVTLGIPAPIHPALAGQLPEATWLLLAHEMGVISGSAAQTVRQNLERTTALLIGPGWGQEETTFQFISQFLDASARRKKGSIGFVHPAEDAQATTIELPPLVVDADGLKLLSKILEWPGKLPRPSVLTPHPGEMAILTGKSIDEIQSDRVRCAQNYAEEWGHVVILKGAFTVVASPTGDVTVIPVATSALARAGTGDVLAGMITGLLAQKLPPYEAAVAAAWLHAQAGLAAERRLKTSASVLAGDILTGIPEVMAQV